MDKLVSVVIPTFDRKILTDRAINSIAPSRSDFFEVIVVDDCGEVPYEYAQKTNPSGVPVRTFRTEKNGGPGLARKIGVDKATSPVIAFLDSDDQFESGWPDAVLAEVLRHPASIRDGIFIAGDAEGGSTLQRWIIRVLSALPESWQSVCVRLATVAFNPFYTPATVISKKLCAFLSSNRYCEDYFTNMIAIFTAQRISVLPITACKISRSPGATGGLSGLQRNMLNGEFEVRKRMLCFGNIPLQYRLLVPAGMGYALVRVAIKSLPSFVRALFSTPHIYRRK